MVKKKKKTLKIFSGTKEALRLNHGILHPVCKIYQVCPNDEPRMTFDLFTMWSNLYSSCYGNTGRMLHGICRYVLWLFYLGECIVAHEPLVFLFLFFFCFFFVGGEVEILPP